MGLRDRVADLNALEFDLESFEVSDFLDETVLSDATEIANVMGASCTTCECCCSVSTAIVAAAEPKGDSKSYFTSEQLATLKRRPATHQVAPTESEWPKLIVEAKGHLERGTNPSDPAVQKLAKRWMELLHTFSDDHNTLAATGRLYREQGKLLGELFGPERLPDEKLAAYIKKALDSGAR